jgi:Protein of unknown function (DUF2752)
VIDGAKLGTARSVRGVAKAAPWDRVGSPQFRGLVFATALFAALFFLHPPQGWGVCGFLWLTGHPCPLCGMTRAMFALAKGHFGEAVRFNALAHLGFVMVFSLFWSSKFTGRLWTFGIAAFGVYGVTRFFVTQ